MDSVEKLESQAIEAALLFDWDKAISLNKALIAVNPEDICAHLRLGFAFMQTHNWHSAKQHYFKALKLQPGHNLAMENMEKIKVLECRSQKKPPNHHPPKLDPNLFLEIPGKTRTITLVNPGQKNILAHLSIGQEVVFKPKRRKIEIRTKEDEYVGCLPDDISKRLTYLIRANGRYVTCIKEAALNNVVVFVREEFKGYRMRNFLSFPKNIQANLQQMNPDEEEDGDNDEGHDEHGWSEETALNESGHDDEENDEIFPLSQDEEEDE
ncbi:tetratricopeptide repeat protein [Patescibacteria group bacterium]|nr:tetratricopeptide repeat protein [Patescibacteria group bacterium]MCL5091915.1 tetratricopeptide repeat protein [Patescibacteria group bacterium]